MSSTHGANYGNATTTNNNASAKPSKLGGQWQAAKGNMKEGLGTITGSDRLKQSGREQVGEGEARTAAARGGFDNSTDDRTGTGHSALHSGSEAAAGNNWGSGTGTHAGPGTDTGISSRTGTTPVLGTTRVGGIGGGPPSHTGQGDV